MQSAKRAGHDCASLTREAFPLDDMLPVIERIRDRLENGLGLHVLRGVPTWNYQKPDLRLMYWGLGLHLGTPVSQSRNGDLLGDVKNFNIDIKSHRGRGYTSKQRLDFHTDSCDVVALFVLNTAMQGGLSMLASSLAIHDEIKRTRPDLLELLYQPFYWSWREQEPPGDLPYYPQPVYTVEQGRFSSRFVPGHIRNGQRYPDVPRLTDAQVEAINLIETIANDPRFHFAMMFQPGDFQFLNNHLIYHARTDFEDYPEPERCRHLLRMWLSVPNSRPLSPLMSTIFRDRTPGAVRGGFPSRVGTHFYETRVTTD